MIQSTKQCFGRGLCCHTYSTHVHIYTHTHIHTDFHVHHSHTNTLTVEEAESRVTGRLTTFWSCPLLYSICTLTGSPLRLAVSHLPVCCLARRFISGTQSHTYIYTPFSSSYTRLLVTYISTLPTPYKRWCSFFIPVIYFCLFDQFVCFIFPGDTLSLTLSPGLSPFLCISIIFTKQLIYWHCQRLILQFFSQCKHTKSRA